MYGNGELKRLQILAISTPVTWTVLIFKRWLWCYVYLCSRTRSPA